MQGLILTRRFSKLIRSVANFCIILISWQSICQTVVLAAENDSALAHKVPPTVQQATYRVSQGDTLLGIAQRFKQSGIHQYQTALAIFVKNPQAFKNNNLNQLRISTEIVLPDREEVEQVSLSIAQNFFGLESLTGQRRASDYLQVLKGQLADTIKEHDEQQQQYDQKLQVLRDQQAALKKQKFQQNRQAERLEVEIKHAQFLKARDVGQTKLVKGELSKNNDFRHMAQVLPPLLQKAEKLYCATEQKEARGILQELFDTSGPGKNWPDEWLGQHPKRAILHAGTMDILLSILHRTLERFPDLTNLTERVVLQWDYCSVLDSDQGFVNQRFENGNVVVNTAAQGVPLNWSGFRQWGFLDDPEADQVRYVPELLEISQPYFAYEIFLHQVYRQHCFPHPVTGKIYNEVIEEPVFTRAVYPVLSEVKERPYPYNWRPYCETPVAEYKQKTDPALNYYV